MTERIYYIDAYVREFDATVLETADEDGRRVVILDRTAFYPTSGGQPFDTGTLGAAQVVDVIDRDDGVVLHVIQGALEAGPVHASIDWDRRFEHMQQHTGQHVLSAAFERLYRVRTESFHLGATSATIDLAREVSPSELMATELAANQVVWEDRPVRVRFLDASQAAQLSLRKEPARGGTLRIVEVEDYDVSACGGTHVARTGAIGNISLGSVERVRGGTRVEFRCGIRTMLAYRAARDATTAAARLLSTGPDELPQAVERLQSEARDVRRRVKELEENLARHEAAALAARALSRGGAFIVAEALDAWDMQGLKTIAAGIIQRPGHAAILAGGPQPVSVVVARAEGVPLDAAAIVRTLAARFGGKGGGRPELAQGGGLNASPADVIAFARTLV